MKLIYSLFIAVILAFQTFSQEINTMEKVNNIIKEVKDNFAPDKRVAIFNVDASQSSDKITIQGETNLPDAKAELIKKLKVENISFVDNVDSLPSNNLGEKVYGVINLSVANIRSKPDNPEELATQAILGTPIKILKKGKGGYYLVQTPDKYIAWLDNDGFTSMTEKEFDNWNKADKIIYLSEYGFSYSKPDVNSQHVSDLVAGNLLKLVSEENNFFKVTYPDGREAFVNKDEAKPFLNWYNSLNSTGENILKTAYRFIGIPYLWGGTSTKGMDCSGFTKTVYFLNGIILARDASQQVNTGELVDTKNGWENLKPGDLLFFGSKARENKKERITHVAIYIGDGDFIHSSGRVRINSLNPAKPYYSHYRDNMFIRAKRILSSVGKNGIEKILDNDFYK